jgi:carboxyl-terminal processing protease
MSRSIASSHIRRLLRPFVPCTGVALLLGVWLFGPREPVHADDRADDALKTFSQVLATVKSNAYRQIQPTELINGAIEGMLATLDPHTHFLGPDYYDNMKIEQAGSFFGIGISFQMRNGLITVISPIEGTPAYSAGVRAGDQIVKINGESAEGIHQMEVIQKLRGDKGSKVRVSIKREGVSELLEFELVRDIIPLNSISTTYLREDKIGYVKVNHFSKTTPKELDDSLQQLEAGGMQGLILDLRSNPGGLLDAAWKVVDSFLPEGRVIVSTDGRLEDSDYTFKARTNESGREYPIVVLVDGGSASASEIVSGALQDWDRALIVGLPTFGKGLVQRLIPLGRQGESGALQLTTAEYFTPSKRNIQRPYTAYKEHLYAMSGVASPMSAPDEREHYTKGGRKISGGGGITPDHKIEYDEYSATYFTFLRQSAFFNFVIGYVNKHSEIKAIPEVDEALLTEFRKFVDAKKIPIIEAEWTKDLGHIRCQLKAEFANALKGPNERRKVLNEDDVMVKAAIELMPEARRLLQTATAQSLKVD